MDKKHLIFGSVIFGTVVLLFCSLIVLADSPDYVIEGNRVYINTTKAYISVNPHTLTSSGWGEINLVSKTYSGNMDIIFGFNTTKSKPSKIEYYKSQNITKIYSDFVIVYNVTEESMTNASCEYGFEFNKHKRNITYNTVNGTESGIYCFQNFTNIGNSNYRFDFNWSITYHKQWKDISSMFTPVNYDYGGMNKWYISKNITVAAGTKYKLRAYINVPVSLIPSNGKYWVCVKPSHESISDAKANNHLYCIDPWWNTSWRKCRNITMEEIWGEERINEPVNNHSRYMGLNITGLNISNAVNEIRILNKPCREGGTEQPVQIIATDDSTWAEVLFYANASANSNTTWSIYYNSTEAANPNYSKLLLDYDYFETNTSSDWTQGVGCNVWWNSTDNTAYIPSSGEWCGITHDESNLTSDLTFFVDGSNAIINNFRVMARNQKPGHDPGSSVYYFEWYNEYIRIEGDGVDIYQDVNYDWTLQPTWARVRGSINRSSEGTIELNNTVDNAFNHSVEVIDVSPLTHGFMGIGGNSYVKIDNFEVYNWSNIYRYDNPLKITIGAEDVEVSAKPSINLTEFDFQFESNSFLLNITIYDADENIAYWQSSVSNITEILFSNSTLILNLTNLTYPATAIINISDILHENVSFEFYFDYNMTDIAQNISETSSLSIQYVSRNITFTSGYNISYGLNLSDGTSIFSSGRILDASTAPYGFGKWSVDWINETYNIRNLTEFVQPDVNFTIQVKLNASVIQSVNFSGVYINITNSTHRENWTNITPEIFASDFDFASRNEVFINYTGNFVNESAYDTCTRATYKDAEHWTCTSYLNVTTDDIKSYNIKYSINTSRFDRWSSRTGGENCSVNNKTENDYNLSCTFLENEVNVTIWNNFSTSSLSRGVHTVKIKYNTPLLSAPGGPTSPASVCGDGICETGETILNCPEDCLFNFSVEPDFYELTAVDGDELKLTYIIYNYEPYKLTVNIWATSNTTSHEWFMFYYEEEKIWVDKINVNVPAGTLESPGRKEIEVKINVDDIDEEAIATIMFESGKLRIAKNVQITEGLGIISYLVLFIIIIILMYIIYIAFLK